MIYLLYQPTPASFTELTSLDTVVAWWPHKGLTVNLTVVGSIPTQWKLHFLALVTRQGADLSPLTSNFKEYHHKNLVSKRKVFFNLYKNNRLGFLRRRASSDSPRREPFLLNPRPLSPRRSSVSNYKSVGYYKICFVNGHV